MNCPICLTEIDPSDVPGRPWQPGDAVVPWRTGLAHHACARAKWVRIKESQVVVTERLIQIPARQAADLL